ncbi:calcium/proton exchanger [Deinococcus pimensis]|uniref:calcium/proton exchanger n=1 Tax=Deinococcus pimensis TaxID=309888 RepID=UPI00047FA2B9|nr:calcium/proton exchanger [Deinococcus pimensis]
MWLNLLLVFVPVAFVLEYAGVGGTWVFLVSALAILPLAGLMGRATEELAARTGTAVGGLLNATFGNATELIIAFFALQAGRIDVVKASIVGSILGNLLLVLGLSVLLGGLRFHVQIFNRRSAGNVASLLTISVLALLIPTIFDVVSRRTETNAEVTRLDVSLSDATAVVLILLYVANIVFSLVTHRDLISTSDESNEEQHATWSPARATFVLLGATVLVGFMSEFLVGSLEAATATLGLSELFVGLVLIPIIGNAAEHTAAVTFALKNRMELAVTIAFGSTVQVALLVAPVLVLLGLVVGQPMNLVVSQLELVAVAAAVVIANSVSRDGETNWLEGVMLLGVYAILAFAVYYLPA